MNVVPKRFEVTVTAEDPLHLGGLDEPLGGIDNPVAMVGDRLCIPGPSLKGAYRNEVERYLYEQYCQKYGAWVHDSLKPCLPTTQPSKAEKELEGRYRMTPCALKQDPKKRDEPICPVCYLLGAQGLVGFVSVPFLFADKSKRPAVLYSSRIDRVSGTVLSGNRSYQLVEPGTSFSGKLEVAWETSTGWKFGKPRKLYEGYEADKWLVETELREKSPDELLTEFVIERIESIGVIGGFRSKGFGRVTTRIVKQT